MGQLINLTMLQATLRLNHHVFVSDWPLNMLRSVILWYNHRQICGKYSHVVVTWLTSLARVARVRALFNHLEGH